MIITPTCRYSHGNLEPVRVDPGEFWGLFGVYVKRASAGQLTAGKGLTSLEPNEKVFTLKAFRCPVCGYMEIFDEGFEGE